MDNEELTLTDFQKEYLTGLLLGDGCLYLFPRSKSPTLLVGRSQKDIKYLEENYQTFKNLCKSGVKTYSSFDKRTNKTYYSCKIQSRNLKCLEPFYQKWYPSGKKIVPKDIELTPLVCAIWFCDDGCMVRAKNCTNVRLRMKLATHNFTKEDTKFLANKLTQKIGEHYSTIKEGTKHFIVGSDTATRAFVAYVEAVLPHSMNRKYVWSRLSQPTNKSRVWLRHRSNFDLNDKEILILKVLIDNPSKGLSPLQIGKTLDWMRNTNSASTSISYYLKRFHKKGWVVKTGIHHSYKNPISYQINQKGIKAYERISDHTKNL